MDAATARTELIAAGSHPELDVALAHAVNVLRRRFGADYGSYAVACPRHTRHTAASESTGLERDWFAGSSELAGTADFSLIGDLANIHRTPAQDEALALGMHSGMWLPLKNERGEQLGVVGVAAKQPEVFTAGTLAEFRELTALSADFVRRGLLLEQMQFERDLLAQEAALLSLIASAEDEEGLPQRIADGLQRALGADMIVILARSSDSDVLRPVTSPAGVFGVDQWASLSEAMARPGNAPLMPTGPDSYYINTDLAESAESPVEVWLHDVLGHRSLMLANGRITEHRRFALAATRRSDEAWDSSGIAFFGRIARVLEMAIERGRARALAAQQRERLGAQARLLTALDPTRPLKEIASTFAEEIEARFDVECIAITQWAASQADDAVLYRSTRLAALTGRESSTEHRGSTSVRSGHPEHIDLETKERTPDEDTLYQAGVRHLGRIPIGVDDAVSGYVSVAWSEGADAPERLAELENAVRPLTLVIERAGLLANIERQRLTLEATAGILATLATARDPDEACGIIAERLRAFFHADHVVMATLNLEAGTRQTLGFSSAVVPVESLPSRLMTGDAEAYGMTLREAPEVFADLAVLELNPGTAIVAQAGLRALIRAPFELSDGELGIVSVACREPGSYTTDDAGRLADLCRPIGLAIDRMRLIAHMAKTGSLLAAQARILAALGPGATVQSAGQVFVAEARGLFGATHAVVARFSGGWPEIVALSSDHVSIEQLQTDTPFGTEQTTPYAEILEGRAQVVPDLAKTQRSVLEETVLQNGVRTLMRAPILSTDGVVTGMIALGSAVPERWNERDTHTLAELSSALGLVAERAELFDAAEDRNAKVRTLTRLLNTFNASAPPEEVARLFAGEVRRFLHADAVLVAAFDQQSGMRVTVAAESDEVSELLRRRSPLAESSGYAGMLADAAVHYDARYPEAAPAWLQTAAAAIGMGSVVAVRLDVDGTAVGMISAGAMDPACLGDEQRQILTEVAAPLAILLERARVLTSLQVQTQRTQAVVNLLAALGPRETIEEVAQPVTEALREMYAADHAATCTIEDDQLVLMGVDSEVVPHWQIGDRTSRTTVIERIAEQGYYLVRDSQLENEAITPVAGRLRDSGLRSSVRVLIGPAEAPLGMVTVGSRAPGRFSDADARQLAQIVQPLSVVMRFVRGRIEAERRTMRLEYTNRILTRLSAGGTPAHLAAGFLAECRVLFRCAHAAAFYFDHERRSAQLLGLDSDVFDRATLPASGPFTDIHSSRLIEQPVPQMVTDIRNETKLARYQARMIEAGLFSVVRAPLVVQDSVRGAVTLWAHGANAFTLEDAELLGTLTRPYAIALEKASALESLGESELKYRSLVAQAEEMIFQFDSETRAILDANQYTSRALGYSSTELLRLRLDDIIDSSGEDVSANVAQTLQDGELHLVDRHYRRKDGTLIDVDMVASLVSYGGRQAVLVLARDVSERKAFQRQLVQGQKMESLGTMAGHVAHDFNNLLTTILGFAGLLKRSTNLDHEERENLALIEDAARRAADLTGHLLSFARGGLVRFGPVDLRTVVADTMRLAEPSLHSALQASSRVPATPVIVEGDAGQLQHALFNIVSNARDAMPEGGTIDIELRTDGPTASMSIRDTGPGMDIETRTRIFEPFYTTKPLGTGTGLGMSITYGIIQGHHGDVSVVSAPGEGTTFTITLPILAGSAPGAVVDAFNAGDGNLVLVVDDDEMVRRTTSATLASLGYNVVEAPGGATAVEIVRARPERFSVVLLDLVMPGMTGSETFRALTAIRPDLPVVVCTGYAADAHIDTDVKRRIAGLVQKPFTGERLGRALLAAGAHPTRQ